MFRLHARGCPVTTTGGRAPRERGQILVMFAASMVLLIGLLALVIDVTWFWTNSLKVQRAADAAALAGAVWLPDQPGKGTTAALAAARQDGYVPGSGVTIDALQDATRDIQMDVTISAPVQTFFMNLFGIRSLTATRHASAEYVLPVPMGSPLNYFGAFGTLRGGFIQTDTGWQYPTKTLNDPAYRNVPDLWTDPSKAFVDESPDPAENATTANVTDTQGFTTFRAENHPNRANFGMNTTPGAVRFQAGGGIEVVVQASSSIDAGCRLQVEVTANAGAATPTWWGATAANGNPATLSTTPREYEFGGDASTGSNDPGDWWRPSGTWTVANFADANFGVRIRALGAGACTTATTTVDYLKVRINYEESEPPIKGPSGESLAKQGVWAGILSQGADIINGDAYSPENNGSGANADYLATSYDYAVEMQPGTSGGSLYIFDPVFCDTNNNFSQAMGDTWYTGSNAVSTFYDLWDTNNTLYDTSDDTWIAGNSGPTGASNPLFNLFRNSRGTDPSEGGDAVSGGRTNCQRGATSDKTKGAYWHNRWWRMASGLAGPVDTTPRIYRVRVTSTVPGASAEQSSANALNNFSLFASVKGHACPASPADPKCPRVYGLGVMEAFAPLEPSSTADLYLSQISAAYAGKTIRISLWDPGDTNGLTATLSFRMPTSTGYVSAPFTYTATRVASGGSSCNGSGSGTAVTTYSGGSRFNGCWIVFNVPIPAAYTAPTPPGEPGPGWWKIRYTMGSGPNSASDLTTWKTQILGNPVHLVIP